MNRAASTNLIHGSKPILGESKERLEHKKLYAELVQANIYVNLINKEMEKTRQELDRGKVTVQKLQKRFTLSPSRKNEPKPPLKQAF